MISLFYLLPIIQFALLVLRILSIIHWSWWLVLVPFFLMIIFGLVIGAIVGDSRKFDKVWMEEPWL